MESEGKAKTKIISEDRNVQFQKISILPSQKGLEFLEGGVGWGGVL